jgi:hypothetical protein
MKSDAPPPFGGERTSLSMAPVPVRSEPPRFGKPPKNAFDCVRHDARSAAHTLRGFLDLFASGALGPLSPGQEQSIHHLYQAAGRIHELIDTSIDLAEEGRPQRPSELATTSLRSLTSQVAATLMRERPGLRIALEPATPDEQPSLVEPTALTKVVQCLLEMLADNHEGTAIVVRLAQTDLHSALTLLIDQPEPPISAESVTQSLPQGLGLSADFESMAHDLRNRDYLRLKRSEALLSRQRGRLLVTPDLSRVRITLSRR